MIFGKVKKSTTYNNPNVLEAALKKMQIDTVQIGHNTAKERVRISLISLIGEFFDHIILEARMDSLL